MSLRCYGNTLRILGGSFVQLPVEVVLLSCLLFIGYETLKESPKTAALHLENGLRMIRQHKLNNKTSGTGRDQDNIVTIYMEPVFAHLEAIFSKSSASHIQEAGDLDYHPLVLPQQFTRLLEVRGKMLELWMHFLSKHSAGALDAAIQLQVLPA